MKDRKLVWIDLETTGFTELDKKAVYDHKILEIGVLITDSKFNELNSMNLVIGHKPEDRLLADDVVMAMHEKNGLWEESSRSSVTLTEAVQMVINFIAENGVGLKGSPLCGSGIQFDRMFLEAQMPDLNNYLHYRNLDVSAVKEFLKTISPDFEPKKKLAHRALDDIRESLSEAKHYRALLEPLLKTTLPRIDDAPSP